MGPTPRCHPPEGEECETLVQHGLPLWAEPAVGYCSRRPRPSPMWGSRFVGAREVGPWVGEQKPLGKTPLGGNPSPELTYLPTLREANASLKAELKVAHAEGDAKDSRIVDLEANLGEATSNAHEWHVKAKDMETQLQAAKTNED